MERLEKKNHFAWHQVAGTNHYARSHHYRRRYRCGKERYGHGGEGS